MRPLRTDLSIFEQFEFEHAPVGVKFLFTRPDGVERIEGTMPLCQMIVEAQKRKKPFYMAPENEDCFGTAALGMEDMPTFAEAGLIGEKFEIYQERRANERIYQHVPSLARGTTNYAAFAALEVLDFEPDLLILMTTPSQAEIVFRALSYTTGEVWESKKTIVLSCAWLYVYPYQTGKVNYMVTGMSFGSKAKEVFPEGKILISIPWDKIPVIVSSLGEMKWALPSYTDGREEFYQRKARVLDESAREAENV